MYLGALVLVAIAKHHAISHILVLRAKTFSLFIRAISAVHYCHGIELTLR
jgi:hypothetical protein